MLGTVETMVSNSILCVLLQSSKGIDVNQINTSSVQLLSRVLTLCNPMNHSTPGFPVHHQLLESTQTHVHWVGETIQTSHPLLSPSPAFHLSQHQGLFQWVNSSHEVAMYKYWSFSFSIIPSKEIPGLISFRMDWLDLLVVQGTLESSLTPQFKGINSSALSPLHSPTLTSIHDYCWC